MQLTLGCLEDGEWKIEWSCLEIEVFSGTGTGTGELWWKRGRRTKEIRYGGGGFCFAFQLITMTEAVSSGRLDPTMQRVVTCQVCFFGKLCIKSRFVPAYHTEILNS